MTTIESIKAMRLAARKARNTTAAATLTTLLNEVENVGKNSGNRDTTEAEAKEAVIKFRKDLMKTLTAVTQAGDQKRIETTNAELALVDNFLPKQLTDDQIEAVMVEFIAKQTAAVVPRDLASMMKDRYPGQYDGKVAFQIATKLLAK